MPGEAHAVGDGLGVEARRGTAGVGGVGDHARRARSRSDSRAWRRCRRRWRPGTACASSFCAFITSSMPCVAAERGCPSSRSASHRALSLSRSISSETSRLAWAYLIAPRLACAVFHARSSASVFTGAGGAERGEPRVEVALHAVLQHHRAVGVLALGPVGAAARAPGQEVVLRVGVDDARDVGRVDDLGALGLQHRDGVGHRLGLRLVQPAARFLLARHA